MKKIKHKTRRAKLKPIPIKIRRKIIREIHEAFTSKKISNEYLSTSNEARLYDVLIGGFVWHLGPKDVYKYIHENICK